MRIVSDNTPEDIARNRASEDVRCALAELAANILRMIRGAGKPAELDRQVYRFAEAVGAYRDAAGHYPDPAMYARALSLDTREELLSRCSEQDRMRDYAEQMIVRGALQVVASRMLHQLTIETSGDREMSSGVRELERVHEENRRRMRAELKGQPRKRKARKVVPL